MEKTIEETIKTQPHKPTSEIIKRYDEIIELQKNGYPIKSILNAFIEANILPKTFTVKRMVNTLSYHRCRKKKIKENFDTRINEIKISKIESQERVPEEINPTDTVEIPVANKEGFIPIINNLLNDEERAIRRAENRQKDMEERAKRRATRKEKEQEENPGSIKIDPVTRSFTYE